MLALCVCLHKSLHIVKFESLKKYRIFTWYKYYDILHVLYISLLTKSLILKASYHSLFSITSLYNT